MQYTVICVEAPIKIKNTNFLPKISSPFLAFRLFIYLGFYVAFNTVQVISRRVVGRAKEPVHTAGQGSVL